MYKRTKNGDLPWSNRINGDFFIVQNAEILSKFLCKSAKKRAKIDFSEAKSPPHRSAPTRKPSYGAIPDRAH